jgi:two-component system, sensor histidine kinase
LTRLVDDLLDVSRISRGKVILKKECIRLAYVVADAVEIARPHVEARKHQLTVSEPPEPVWLEADPTRLAQVVSNLLNNAAKYTEKGPGLLGRPR